MSLTEILLLTSTIALATGWLKEIHDAKEQSRRFTQCRDELTKLIQSIRQTDELARKSKFVHFYP